MSPPPDADGELGELEAIEPEANEAAGASGLLTEPAGSEETKPTPHVCITCFAGSVVKAGSSLGKLNVSIALHLAARSSRITQS